MKSWIVAAIAVGLVLLLVTLGGIIHGIQQGQQNQRFLQWETCSLNSGSNCGQMPTP